MEPIVAAPHDAAAAPPASTEPQSAVAAAVATDNTGAYRVARRAERAGKPLPPVPVATAAVVDPPVDPAAPSAEPKLTRKERDQQETNDRVRTAVERATADLRAEIDRLKAPARPAAPATAATDPPAEKVPDWKRFASMPDAPKLADFDSVEDHAAAMAVFVNDQRYAERQTADRQSADASALTAAQHTRVEKFVAQLDASKKADPAFLSKLTPEVRALKPFGALQPGEASGPLNIVAEQIYDSPIAPKVLVHFSEHPEELARLAALPADLQALPAAARVKAHIQWIVREFGKLEGRLETPASPAPVTPKPKLLTDAPAPVAGLGGKPAEAVDPKKGAVMRGDTRAYREVRRQERAAALGR